MTMQVGMLASDGIVLASDTKASRDSAGADDLVTDDWYGCSKVKLSDSGQMAVACAMDLVAAKEIADALLVSLTPEYWENPEGKIKEICFSQMGNIGIHLEVECLIALSQPLSLYKFQYARNGSHVLAERILTFAHSGHASNAAIFWSLRHYAIQPMQKLIPLASMLVVDAANINSARVGGLEVVYGDIRGFHRYSLEENRRLESEVKRRSGVIGRQALKPFSVSSSVL